MIYSFGTSTYDETTLTASLSYQNSICWSSENLLAVASGKHITILNPASLAGPRGLITLSQNKPFPIGVVSREDLFRPCLMPICLSRNYDPCVRSISWSPSGFSPNSGCLLSVCTTDGHVKLYRSPYIEFRSEWIEIADVSQMLYEYLASTNFSEADTTLLPIHQANEDESAADLRDGKKLRRKRDAKRLRADEANSGSLPLITPEQYTSRSAILSSVIVAWSPVLPFLKDMDSQPNCTILAIGAKSGDVSFWRICVPERYSVSNVTVSINSELIGFLKAHDSWVSAIGWGFSVASSCNSRLILATGSSNGSVKLWSADVEEVIQITEANRKPFSLLAEVKINGSDPVSTISLFTPEYSQNKERIMEAVILESRDHFALKIKRKRKKNSRNCLVLVAKLINVGCFCIRYLVKINGSDPVSTISLITPENSQNKAVLAIGGGSGSVEVWIYDLSNNKLVSAGSYHSHNQMVMGLEFSFDGRRLFSCGQDNSVYSWAFDGSHLHETNFPSDIPGNHNTANKLSHLSDLCFGIAVSPGEMMIAVGRNLDPKLLNPMYQAVTQKAMVELVYTGGQNLEITKEPLNSSNINLAYWESNILCSLKKYENYKKDLVIWDIMLVLLVLKKSNPGLVERLLCKWISGWFSDIQQITPLEHVLSHLKTRVSNLNTRKLHLISVICRRIHFIDSKSDEEREMWHEVLVACEKELRERLVGLTFTQILNQARKSCSGIPGRDPVRVGQMVQWVSASKKEASDWLKNLLSKIKKLRNRIKTLCEYTTEEKCSYCSAPVQFESPEIAWCNGGDLTGGSPEAPHKLHRCAVSMRLCSIADPVWFCICCRRCVDKLPPQKFFSIASCENVSLGGDGVNLPLCPFCGIMLQRQLPEFLLSINPV